MSITVGGNRYNISGNAFKVGGSNVVSSIDKLILPAGATTFSNPTAYSTITLTDAGQLLGGTDTSNMQSYSVTASSGANALVVAVTWERNGRSAKWRERSRCHIRRGSN